MTSPSLVMVGQYNSFLVSLSVLISLLAAYATLELAGRVIAASGRARLPWLLGGGAASGIGTWSMHFTAMRAFNLPVQVLYDWHTALLSLLPAIFASSVAILVVSRRESKSPPTLAGGILIGGGIAVLHYTAMDSMRLPAMCHYSPALVTLSVLLAMLVSLVPLRLTFLSLEEPAAWGWRKAASIFILGTANPVMHFTGMAGTTFTRSQAVPDLSHAVSMSAIGLQVFTIVPLMVLTVALVASLVDQLRKNEDRLRLVIDTIPLMAWSVRPDGTVDFLNQRWIEYTGLSLEKYVEEPTRPIHPEDIPRVIEKWRAGLADGNPYEVEMRLRRANGEYRWFLVRTAPLRDERGNIVKWYGSSIDIEDRKQANEELRQAEDRIRAILEFSPNWIFLKDTEGRYLLVNREVERVFRISQEQIKGKTDSEIFPPERAAEYRANDLKVLQEGLTMEFEEIADLEDGPHTSIVHKFPLFDTHGTIYAIGGVATDITEREQAKRQLRRSEAYLAAGQRLSHTGSWALNVSSGELFWSQETYRIFGFDPAKTTASVKETFLPRIHPEDRTKIDEGLKAAAIHKGSYGIDYRIVLPDGSIKYIHDAVYPVTSETGDVVERYGVIMDVTERKRAEEELQRSLDQLRALAARLESVREEERSRVAREIHDELGQALTAIKIDLSSLIRDLPPEKKQRAEPILKEADEAIQSVRRISTELRPGILDDLGLVAAIEWAAEEFQARNGIQCHVSVPKAAIEMAPERATGLFRIFQETLTNVARHANATQVDVRLAHENGDLILEVHDNGKGLSEEQASVGKSLGILGMRERALLLGGRLDISGAPGKGTTMRVRVPKGHRTVPEEGK